ncbi:MAG: aminomethyl-transferring glycine dehydrogenase [Micavibrio sp.]|nr:aminomethyl-transferring glycine dehydrogenase [Micavibrio sp.]
MRYLPQTKKNREAMLEKIGVNSVDDLFKDVPKKAFVKGQVDLPEHMSELQVERTLGNYANQNRPAISGPFFLGAGVYHHHIPSTGDYIIQRSEFLTAYTPYQPEIAQGTLQMIYEYQTMIAQLTGQDIANASLYDGATATAEAVLMAMRLTKRSKVVLATSLNPQYKDVLDTYMWVTENAGYVDDVSEDVAAVIVQTPDFHGNVHGLDEWRKKCDETGAKLIVVVTEILSLGLCPAPTQADIVCGEGQSIGLPMSYGGPHLGFFACREEYLRQIPGRLCGETVDADGKRAFVLTLSTREQHIRREKATSNICTNQGLCALAFTVHMSLLGEDGFKTLSQINHAQAGKLADALAKIDGVKIETENFFNEFVVSLPKDAQEICDALAEKNITAGLVVGEKDLLVAATEMTTESDIEAFASALKDALA